MRANRVSFGSGTDVAEPWRAVLAAKRRTVGIRPMRPADAPRLFAAYQRLSQASRRQRFLSAISEYTAGRLDGGEEDDRPEFPLPGGRGGYDYEGNRANRPRPPTRCGRLTRRGASGCRDSLHR